MTNPIDPSNNVVHFQFKKRSPEDLPAPPVKRAKGKDVPFCSTHFFEYDMDLRTVECSRCGRNFDPLEALEHLGNQWRNYDLNHREVRREIADLQKERDRIAKQVTNLKGQRRRLVPNVRQDVDRIRSELWDFARAKKPEIADPIMRSLQQRIARVLNTIDTFGDEAAPAVASSEKSP